MCTAVLSTSQSWVAQSTTETKDQDVQQDDLFPRRTRVASNQLNVSRLSSPAAPAILSTALDVQTISLHLVYCSRHYRHPPGRCACAIRRPRSTSCLRGRRHPVPCTVSPLYLPPTQGGTRIETRRISIPKTYTAVYY